MRVGIWLPSLASGDSAGRLREYMLAVERAGLDIWTLDEILSTEGLYATSWPEALTTLSYAAGLTRKARIGTGILVLPQRNPVVLAKEIATIDYLSGGRLILGVGAGGSPTTLEAAGARLSERGPRTDEMLAALRLLLTQSNADFDGTYYRFHDVTIQPRPKRLPEIWVAGGSRQATPNSFDRPVLAPSVLERILSADGWLARCSGTQETVKEDWRRIRQALLERRGTTEGFVFAHCNFIHVVDTDDTEKALAEQAPIFERVMGTDRTLDQLRQSYLLGSPQEQIERIRDLEAVGLSYLVLGPMTDDQAQLELLVEKVIRPLQ